ncbi:MAG: hypothetical protein M3Q73_00725 [bacterium]|nr:hypothetical protein [bacterium]
MTLWFTLFIVSGAAIILFIVIKRIQAKFKVLLFWPEARNRLDARMQDYKVKVIEFFQREEIASQAFYLKYVVQPLKQRLEAIGGKMDTWRIVQSVKGKKNIVAGDKSTFFMNDGSSFRNRFRR